ncbi:antirestriction protein ArdA [Gordonia sp. MP11Mi]|uniref:Antirestriction protein ArdA n=1 Tax=Gordonia sp. MP11Mi TaxID=3022769 RepID=A0AA97CXH4_9ACTN
MADVNAPRVWIGCLECGNAGSLVGDWYDATEAGDITTSQLHGRAIPAETHEELWVMDLDGDWPVRREMDPAEAARWGEIYEEVGDDAWPAFCAWVRSGSYVEDGDGMPSTGDFEERFAGTWPDFRTYAFQLAEDTDMFDGLPEDHIAVRYFDWDSWIRDLKFDYTVERAPGYEVFIFHA